MSPVLGVLRISDSFAELWPMLASTTGAELRVAESVSELGNVGDVGALLLAAGGTEHALGEVLRELRESVSAEVVVVGAETDHRLAVSLLLSGAANYFALPADLAVLRAWVVEWADRATRPGCAAALAAAQREQYDFSQMVGQSPAFRAALERASRVIPRGSARVLIAGESGTGKELLAQAIHYNGPRAASPFVELNCAALPENLLEAELFGYERGAFTDARSAKPGLFEAAHRGTLFLDEVGDLSLNLQAKLLKALESKRVRRLGSVHEREVDVRVVAATHVDLVSAVRDGRFRKDLYYRLSVLPVSLPALRERGDDVVLLARHFMEKFSREYEVSSPGLSAELRRALLAHPWPGNIRELKNSMERAVLLGQGELHLSDIFLEGVDAGLDHRPDGVLPFPAPMAAIEKAAARAMLQRFEGNKSRAAAALGISRTHLYTLLDGAVAEESSL